eukprot:CAMPEP_0170174010 /NCGR_PEP_ID=MMETSP0040_2-20121228/7279_1 /TAXON_ID=641309 /ORGANISM="Lotharella oceanica, Strain CCMP622" /LENGTH=53 /DNA_ID=CAMNT_0010415477 /DNA_START=467 /DNA_END=624 /DNA_ORIENTATION=+
MSWRVCDLEPNTILPTPGGFPGDADGAGDPAACSLNADHLHAFVVHMATHVIA